MMAVFTSEDQNVAGESGPIDDGFITNAVGSLPGDPYCCTGPEPEPDTDDGDVLLAALATCITCACVLQALLCQPL